MAKPWRRNADCRCLKPCYIKRFGRRDKRNTVVPAIVIYACKRNVLLSGLGYVAMYFIGYNRNAVFFAQYTDLFKLFPAPYSARRILRIAKYHKRCLRVGKLLFKVVIIHTVSIIPVYQSVFKHLSAVVLNTVAENIVYRCLYHYLLGRCSYFADYR